MVNLNVEDDYSAFSSREYLKALFPVYDGWDVGSTNYALLRFFAQAYSDVPDNSVMLEFGGGPTIYQLISAAAKVKEIHFSDYLDSNLEEVKLWKENGKNKFDWTIYFKNALSFEECFKGIDILNGVDRITNTLVKKREKLLRNKLTNFFHCNAFLNNPLGSEFKGKYDIVAVNLVMEGITTDMKAWKKIVKNITSLLKPGGVFIATELRFAGYWRIFNTKFPACPVTEMDLIQTLSELGFQEPCVLVNRLEDPHMIDVPEYKGLFMVKARK